MLFDVVFILLGVFLLFSRIPEIVDLRTQISKREEIAALRCGRPGANSASLGLQGRRRTPVILCDIWLALYE